MSILTKIKNHVKGSLKSSSQDKSLKAFLDTEITTTHVVKMTTTTRDVLDGNEYYYTTEDFFLFHDMHISGTSSDTKVIQLSGEKCGQQFNYTVSGDTIIVDTGSNIKYYTSREEVRIASKRPESSTIQIKEIYKGAAKANNRSKKMAQQRRVARSFTETKINQAENNGNSLFES